MINKNLFLVLIIGVLLVIGFSFLPARKTNAPTTDEMFVGTSTQQTTEENTNPEEQTAPVSMRFETGLNQASGGMGITIEPKVVLEDSRCPVDVQCIQAGTVRVQTMLTSAMGSAEQVFKLNQPITTEAEQITLVEVRPIKNSKIQVKPADYRFVFEVKKRTDSKL